jgi:transcriptional regulator with XRE-family HTH domain
MNEHLGRALKLVRSYHDLSQIELAEKLDISRSYLSEIEAGRKTPSMDILSEYSRQFAVPLSTLLLVSEGFEDRTVSGRLKKSATGKAIRFLEWVDARKAG